MGGDDDGGQIQPCSGKNTLKPQNKQTDAWKAFHLDRPSLHCVVMGSSLTSSVTKVLSVMGLIGLLEPTRI